MYRHPDIKQVDRIEPVRILAVCVVGLFCYLAPLMWMLTHSTHFPALIPAAHAQDAAMAMGTGLMPDPDPAAIDARETVDVWSCRKGC